ncbi:hypothetical protein BH24DEI1_BH24DEI1_17510 [soil metagenome]|jgi:hypothetical protein|nr:hypothetical protein [Deinococcota bacterium]
MPQLHFYVPDEVAERLRQRAKDKNTSLSKYLADVVQREVAPGWPEGYFESVIGKWQGEPLERPEPLPLEEREPFLE